MIIEVGFRCITIISAKKLPDSNIYCPENRPRASSIRTRKITTLWLRMKVGIIYHVSRH
jgi:hypothetical protein